MTAKTANPAVDFPWLRGPGFDIMLIIGTFILGVSLAVVTLLSPNLLWPIILVNLWLFGYHHVISTYTRLCFDKESFSQSKFLIFGLIPIVVVSTLAVAKFVGVWAIFTIYFYWQWWHYTRQSWGVSRAYRGRDRTMSFEDGKLGQAMFYSIPIAGVLHRCYQDPDQFLGSDIFIIKVPFAVFAIAAAIAGALTLYWVYLRVRAWQRGELAKAHTLYVSSHIMMFLTAYIFIKDITIGWLAINVWHNTQYILFVWLFNTNRFKNGVEPGKRFLSYISQRQRWPLYFAVCLMITAVYYLTVLNTLDKLLVITVSASLIIYQMVNFHHYLVDSFIWKVRKPAIRKNMGIST